MNKIATIGVTAILAVGLAGCTPGNNVGGATFAGAAGGGLVGAAAFGGSAVGILGGALLGGVVGNAIGQNMDANDRARMRHAVIDGPVDGGRWEGSDVRWQNERTGARYRFHPVRQTHHNGRYCREYETTIHVGGKTQKAFGKACRMPDGQWRVAS
jgi:surface antigen